MKTYADLLLEYGSSQILYKVLLETKEWFEKRNEIVKRDGSRCTSCNILGTVKWPGGGYAKFEFEEPFQERKINGEVITVPNPNSEKVVITHLEQPVILQVHHDYYLKDKLPWEYPNSALTTLCEACHKELHKLEK